MGVKFTFIALSGLIAASLSSCSSNSSSRNLSTGNWEREARMVAGSTRTPKHSLPNTEYPFDDTGNYIAAWAARGESRFGKAHSTWAAVVTPGLDGMVAVARKAVEAEEKAVAEQD